MAHRAEPHIETKNRVGPPQWQSTPRRRWWDTILDWLGCHQSPEINHRQHTDEPEPEPWAPEEAQVIRRYHARNLAAARRSTEQLVREGWHTGPVPYGYRPQRIRISPAGRRPRFRTRLMIEPVEASVVKMIFLRRLDAQLPVDEIVERLNSSRYPAPIRTSTIVPEPWTDVVVLAILGNPKYTGYQVWGRTHHRRPAPFDQWVWSGPWAHPPVVDVETFLAAQQLSPRTPPNPAQDGQIARAA